jgi:hypothetical protein
MNNWTKIIALKDVHKDQPFRVVAGPSGHLTNDIFVKGYFVEEKDKYLCNTLEVVEPDGQLLVNWGDTKFFSPRFKVYVQEAS